MAPKEVQMEPSWLDTPLFIAACILVFGGLCVVPLLASVIKDKYFKDDI